MDVDTRTFLLAGGNLGVPDREARGLWPHPPIPFADLVSHIVQEIERTGLFPGPWKNEPGPGVIERKPDSAFVWIRYDEVGVLREQLQRSVFRSPVEAAREYLRWNFNLPACGGLDGWKVV